MSHNPPPPPPPRAGAKLAPPSVVKARRERHSHHDSDDKAGDGGNDKHRSNSSKSGNSKERAREHMSKYFPPAKPASRVLSAVEKAKETLEKIKGDEEREKREAEERRSTKVLGRNLDWQRYIYPRDVTDMDECRRIDTYNQSVFEHNNAMLSDINDLLKKMGLQPHRCDPPPDYLSKAKQHYEGMLFNPEFRVIRAVLYLSQLEPEPKFPTRDYDMIDGPEIADNLAFDIECQRLIESAGDELIDISDYAGKGHQNNCTCENRWDGVSERCVGEGVRVRWVRQQGHHFLRPRVIPEIY